ncbi:FadR/GntR family transcriptional regulator [Nocardia heshunensis]
MAELAKPVRNATLSQQIADELRTRIVAGDWPVGTKIPAEPELMAMLGVSRSTVREALRSLVHTRMLEARAGDGTYVRSDSALEFALLERIEQADLRDVLEIRAMLELHTVRLAAQRCTPAHARQLRALLENLEQATAQAKTVDEWLPAAIALFHGMTAATGNSLLAELYHHLDTATSRDLTQAAWQHDIARKSLPLQRELVDAITGNDPDRAEQTVRQLERVFLLAAEQ